MQFASENRQKVVSAMNASCYCTEFMQGFRKKSFLLALFQSNLPFNQDVDFDTLARLPAFKTFVPSKYSSLEQVWIANAW